MTAFKTCPRCGVRKDADGFAKHLARKDGLQPYCRACKAGIYADNKARAAALARARYMRNKLMSTNPSEHGAGASHE